MTQTTFRRQPAPATWRPTRPATPTSSLPILVLGAIGVVYGDIGTSPLYAFREALHVSTGGGAPPKRDDPRACCR